MFEGEAPPSELRVGIEVEWSKVECFVPRRESRTRLEVGLRSVRAELLKSYSDGIHYSYDQDRAKESRTKVFAVRKTTFHILFNSTSCNSYRWKAASSSFVVSKSIYRITKGGRRPLKRRNAKQASSTSISIACFLHFDSNTK